MGLHDVVEICELIGIYLFGKLSKIIDKKNIGLHRTDESTHQTKDDFLHPSYTVSITLQIEL